MLLYCKILPLCVFDVLLLLPCCEESFSDKCQSYEGTQASQPDSHVKSCSVSKQLVRLSLSPVIHVHLHGARDSHSNADAIVNHGIHETCSHSLVFLLHSIGYDQSGRWERHVHTPGHDKS